MAKFTPDDAAEMKAQAGLMAQAWMNIASEAASIAHSKRILYQAYLSEGFTEAQALELCKQP